jgi:anthranilate synthase component 1
MNYEESVKATTEFENPLFGTAATTVVSRQIGADLETPVSAYYKLRGAGAVFLLESVEQGVSVGRYSFIGIRPEARAIIRQSGLEILGLDGQPLSLTGLEGLDNPQAALRALFRRSTVQTDTSMPPLLGGAVGYIGYDMIRYFERITESIPDLGDTVLAELYLVDTLVVFDHANHQLSLLKLARSGDESQAKETLDHLASALQSPIRHATALPIAARSQEERANFTRESFCAAVERTKEHILAGDVYQLVLSQRIEGETSADPFTVYRSLRMLNPSPYMYFFDFGDRHIIGSSPEALVTLNGSRAKVRPIAGTRPRGQSPAHDRQLAEELLKDEKERAEHVMLVDLGRNDLGRCCRFGTVSVAEYMEVERFSHVMHICSTVTGDLREGVSPFDLFKSTFPAGTVSGAPKIRAMQIIEELEPSPRGIYAGAVGYVSLSGDMDWCIGIRTILMHGNNYCLQAGAGIVADSLAEREYEETLHKMAALRRAITMAEEGIS